MAIVNLRAWAILSLSTVYTVYKMIEQVCSSRIVETEKSQTRLKSP